jgi:hypothetical protein
LVEKRRKKNMFNQPVLVLNQIVDDIACSQGEDRHILIAIVLQNKMIIKILLMKRRIF